MRPPSPQLLRPPSSSENFAGCDRAHPRCSSIPLSTQNRTCQHSITAPQTSVEPTQIAHCFTPRDFCAGVNLPGLSRIFFVPVPSAPLLSSSYLFYFLPGNSQPPYLLDGPFRALLVIPSRNPCTRRPVPSCVFALLFLNLLTCCCFSLPFGSGPFRYLCTPGPFMLLQNHLRWPEKLPTSPILNSFSPLIATRIPTNSFLRSMRIPRSKGNLLSARRPPLTTTLTATGSSPPMLSFCRHRE